MGKKNIPIWLIFLCAAYAVRRLCVDPETVAFLKQIKVALMDNWGGGLNVVMDGWFVFC